MPCTCTFAHRLQPSLQRSRLTRRALSKCQPRAHDVAYLCIAKSNFPLKYVYFALVGHILRHSLLSSLFHKTKQKRSPSICKRLAKICTTPDSCTCIAVMQFAQIEPLATALNTQRCLALLFLHTIEQHRQRRGASHTCASPPPAKTGDPPKAGFQNCITLFSSHRKTLLRVLRPAPCGQGFLSTGCGMCLSLSRTLCGPNTCTQQVHKPCKYIQSGGVVSIGSSASIFLWLSGGDVCSNLPLIKYHGVRKPLDLNARARALVVAQYTETIAQLTGKCLQDIQRRPPSLCCHSKMILAQLPQLGNTQLIRKLQHTCAAH